MDVIKIITPGRRCVARIKFLPDAGIELTTKNQNLRRVLEDILAEAAIKGLPFQSCETIDTEVNILEINNLIWVLITDARFPIALLDYLNGADYSGKRYFAIPEDLGDRR